MSAIVLLDTSVYLNVLDVPGRNQDRKAILDVFEHRVVDGDHFLLPMAAIWETGNHISRLESGETRYRLGQKLVADVGKAIAGEAPYRPTHFPEREEFLTWLQAFPDWVKRDKSHTRTDEGPSLVDLSIFKEWERTRSQYSMSRVLIWSLDSDLAAYDTGH